MLKTLRITSLAVVVLAVCGVLLIIFLGLRENPAIIKYLESPGVIEKFKSHVTDGGQKNLESPLVAQAHLFKLRIDPPPPPPKPTPVKPPERTVATRTPPPKRETPPPAPKTPVNAKFTLLATVLCEENPSRSMVLLRQAGNKDEWFWQGEKVGNLDVTEVRNGSAVFTQNGGNRQELFVPAKPATKSLLKAEAAPTRPVGAGGSINVLVDPETGEPVTEEQAAAAGVVSAEGIQEPSSAPGSRRSTHTDRPQDTSVTREELSSRIRRIRTVPRQPTVEEQQAKIETSISNIQAIMNRESAAVDADQRQEANEDWMRLLNSLREEKQRLEQAKATADEQGDTSEAGQGGDSETGTPPEKPSEK
jgi:hypothetical protein